MSKFINFVNSITIKSRENASTAPPSPKRQLLSGLTWADISFPTSPNFRDSEFPRMLSMKDPRWLFTRERVESIIEYKFTKPELLRQAMYPVQYGWACITDIDGSPDHTFEKGNHKLAHMGDSLLKTVAVDTWFWRMAKAKQLHETFALYSKNIFLNEVAQKKGLSEILQIWFRNGIIKGPKTEATTVEAIIGAVWFDSGNDLHEIRKLVDLLVGTSLVSEHKLHYPTTK